MINAVTTSFDTACPHCDLWMHVPALQDGAALRCRRCGSTITARRDRGMTNAMALAISALVLLVLSLSFPFLRLSQAGLENEMTILSAIAELYASDALAFSLLLAGLIVVAPMLWLSLQLATLLFVFTGTGSLAVRRLVGRGIAQIQAWSMAEVFLIGTLVSLVKLIGMAEVVVGISFFSYFAFVLCLVAIGNNLDRHTLWRALVPDPKQP